MASGFPPDFNMSQLSDALMSTATSLGVPRELAATLMSDPARLRRIIEQSGNVSSSLQKQTFDSDSELKSESYWTNQISHFKANDAREKARPPQKVPLIPRREVLREIDIHRSASVKDFSGHKLRQTFIGTRPSFCQTPVDKLQRILLADLFLRRVHEGNFLLCRIISQTTHLVAVNFAVEDPRGDAIKVSVYNYPCTLDASEDETDALFPIGTVLAVLEPFYKTTMDGVGRMIRVDSPSDIVFIIPDDDILKNVKWFSGATVANAPKLPTTAHGWKEFGISEFKACRWLSAATCFSNALRQDEKHVLSRLNRAEVYLRLEWYNSALSDCEELLNNGLFDELLLRKAIFRAMKAAYFLGDYDRALEFASLRPDDVEYHSWVHYSKQRLLEKTTGQYDWSSLFRQAQKKDARIEVAEYVGPIEIRQSKKQDSIRGTYATRDISVGELLLVAKPMACGYPEDNPDNGKETFYSLNFLTEKMNRYSQVALIYKIVQYVWDSSEQANMLRSMYAGPAMPDPLHFDSSRADPTPLTHARQPVTNIDVGRIEAVVSFNSFAPQTDPIPSLKTVELKDFVDRQRDLPSALYFRPSLFNHACLASAHRCFFGDVMAIRASRAISMGEEITLEYFPGSERLEERNTRSRHWGFECKCTLCLADRVDGEKSTQLRFQLREEYASSTRTIRTAKDLVKRVEATYKDSPERARCATKPDLSLAYHSLAQAYGRNIQENSDFCRRAIEYEMDSLAAIGLVITDRSVFGPVPREGAQTLPVDTRYGPTHLHEYCTMFVLQIVAPFYQALEDTRRARDWMRVALWLEDTYIGGGKDLFMLRFGTVLNDLRLMDIARSAFS